MATRATLVLVKPMVKTPNPKSYVGAHDVMELDNFLWQLEQYFEMRAL